MTIVYRPYKNKMNTRERIDNDRNTPTFGWYTLDVNFGCAKFFPSIFELYSNFCQNAEPIRFFLQSVTGTAQLYLVCIQ